MLPTGASQNARRSLPSHPLPPARTGVLMIPSLLARGRGQSPAIAAGLAFTPLLALLPGGPAAAHHAEAILQLSPTPLSGLISGLAHPVLGPDHLLFLLALSLVGLRQRRGWMLALLAVGLLGSWAGLVLPGLPGSEPLAALSLVLVAAVLLGRAPRSLLLPAFALHGYVLSGSVLGWSAMPLATYLLGLAISQGLLLIVSLLLLVRLAATITPRLRRALAFGLAAVGVMLGLTSLLA
jgi:urease accessory protein